MTLILLEALAALALLVGIVWWTMFAGRSKGELTPDQTVEGPVPPATSPPSSPAAKPQD